MSNKEDFLKWCEENSITYTNSNATKGTYTFKVIRLDKILDYFKGGNQNANRKHELF